MNPCLSPGESIDTPAASHPGPQISGMQGSEHPEPGIPGFSSWPSGLGGGSGSSGAGTEAGLDGAADGEPVRRVGSGGVVAEEKQHLAALVDWQDPGGLARYGCHHVSFAHKQQEPDQRRR